MSILNFSEIQELGILSSNGSLVLGGFSIDSEIELEHISVMLYKHGGSVTGERIRVRVTSDIEGTRTILTSAWSNLADASNINDGDYWLGWIRTDFNRAGFAKNLTRYLVVDIDNYTRDGDNFFIGLSRDYPFPIYSSGAASFEQAAFAATIFGYEED